MIETSSKAVTLNRLREMVEAGQLFSVLTCYDATTARWLDKAGIEVLLVGDTAAEVILGHKHTIHAPLDFMLLITAAVKRGAPRCFVMGDMPFMSYQASEDQAVVNAGRFLTEGGADAVKLEVDESYLKLVDRMSRVGVPVVAHLGSRPQMVRRMGGYRSAGRTAAEAVQMIEQAKRFEDAGAVMLLLEATPQQVTKKLVEAVKIPVIGCGAGAGCAGHVVILPDLLGMSDWQPPFAKPVAHIGREIEMAAKQWIELLRSGKYLKKHVYQMTDEEAAEFDRLTRKRKAPKSVPEV